MNRREVKQIADLLLDSQAALWNRDSTEAMMLCLHWLYETAPRIAAAMPVTGDKDIRSVLRLMGKKARTLQHQIEKRLAVRN